MKKYFLVFLLIIFVIPSATFAAWWNPFSWHWWSWIKKIPQEQTQIPVVDTQVVSTETKTEEKKVITPTKPTQVVVVPDSIPSSITTKTSEVIYLKILNIQNNVTKGKVVVTWQTNLPTKSRLMFDNGQGDVYESENGINIDHRVEILNLVASKEYKYMIFARTEDGEKTDDVFSSFIAFREYAVTLGNFEGGCQTIIIKDTAGRTIAGGEVEILGIYKLNSYTSTKSKINKTTNSEGEVRYCEKANNFEIDFDGKTFYLQTGTSSEGYGDVSA